MSSGRVVITGLGPICTFGTGIDPLWAALTAGRSGISRISRWDPSGFPSTHAAELPDDDFDVRKIVPKSYRKATKVMCRDVELAVGAAAAAVEDAGLITKATDADAEPTIAPGRMGCQIGAGLIASDIDELGAALITSKGEDGKIDLRHWGSDGMQNLTPLWMLKYLPNMLACHVTIVHDCQGPSNTITCCEASSALSLGESMRAIQRGAADACITGGAEYKINPLGMLRQIAAKRLLEDDEQIVRPFDNRAAGTLLGEGGGILIVESVESASARGARAYAEVIGFAATQSRCEDSAGLRIRTDDNALSIAMRIALDHAGISADDIDAIAPLGSGIPNSDDAEARAIKHTFGERAIDVPLITTVPNVGNCVAGQGAISLITAAKCLAEQQLPARLNTQEVDGLDAAESETRDAPLEHIMVCTTSQGGQNVVVIMKRAENGGES